MRHRPLLGAAVFMGVAALAPTILTGAADADKKPKPKVVVEQSHLIYLPDQVGGSFHELLVLVRNKSKKVAVGVTGQVSIKDASGTLVESVNPIPINILPGGMGLIEEGALDLSAPVEGGQVSARLTVDRFVKGPKQSPVSFSDVRLEPDEFSGCTIRGTVSNTFTEQKEDLQLRVAGFVGEQLATGGFTYVDLVFPKEDATFEVSLYSPALCPPGVDRVEVLPNLGEDKIFNP